MRERDPGRCPRGLPRHHPETPSFPKKLPIVLLAAVLGLLFSMGGVIATILLRDPDGSGRRAATRPNGVRCPAPATREPALRLPGSLPRLRARDEAPAAMRAARKPPQPRRRSLPGSRRPAPRGGRSLRPRCPDRAPTRRIDAGRGGGTHGPGAGGEPPAAGGPTVSRRASGVPWPRCERRSARPQRPRLARGGGGPHRRRGGRRRLPRRHPVGSRLAPARDRARLLDARRSGGGPRPSPSPSTRWQRPTTGSCAALARPTPDRPRDPVDGRSPHGLGGDRLGSRPGGMRIL